MRPPGSGFSSPGSFHEGVGLSPWGLLRNLFRGSLAKHCVPFWASHEGAWLSQGDRPAHLDGSTMGVPC
eukprot:710232-Alexandrium_andersonii.AAC.1